MIPRMILFDYGGTLMCEPDWDMLRGERAVFQHVVANPHGWTPEEVSAWEGKYFASLQGVRDLGAEPTEIQMLRLKYDLHGISLDFSLEEAEFLFWDHTAPMTPRCLFPGVEEALAALNKRGIRIGVVSNIGWTGNALRRRINTLLPGNAFEFILASSDYGLRKPDARLFQLALEKAALPPEQVWFIGDTVDTDVRGAQETGLFPVLFRGSAPGAFERPDTPETFPPEVPVLRHWKDLLPLIDALA